MERNPNIDPWRGGVILATDAAYERLLHRLKVAKHAVYRFNYSSHESVMETPTHDDVMVGLMPGYERLADHFSVSFCMCKISDSCGCKEMTCALKDGNIMLELDGWRWLPILSWTMMSEIIQGLRQNRKNGLHDEKRCPNEDSRSEEETGIMSAEELL